MDLDDLPRPKGDAASKLAAEDLSPYSQDELQERISLLEAEIERVRAHHGTATSDAYREANHALHSYIVGASGNGRLAAMVIALIEQHERIIHFSLSLQNRDTEFHHRHDSLVEALIAGEPGRAAEIVEAAIRGSQAKILEAFLSEASPVNTP